MFNANIVDSDQTPRSAASDLCLHYLSMPILWDAGHKRVKTSLNVVDRGLCIVNKENLPFSLFALKYQM